MPDEPATFVPPSQQSAQGPVPKPGEPVRPTKGILAEPKPVTQKVEPKLVTPPKAVSKKV